MGLSFAILLCLFDLFLWWFVVDLWWFVVAYLWFAFGGRNIASWRFSFEFRLRGVEPRADCCGGF